MHNVRILKETQGQRLVIGLLGTPEAVEAEITAAYNWNYFGRLRPPTMGTKTGADVEDKPLSLGNITYFYTTEERLMRGLRNRVENKLLVDKELCAQFKGKKGGVLSILNEEFEKTLATIEDKAFMPRRRQPTAKTTPEADQTTPEGDEAE